MMFFAEGSCLSCLWDDCLETSLIDYIQSEKSPFPKFLDVIQAWNVNSFCTTKTKLRGSCDSRHLEASPVTWKLHLSLGSFQVYQ